MSIPTRDAPVAEARALVRAFGARRALAGVSFELAPGDCLALFGPNGAGKTTLLRVLAGLLKPTGGEARVDGVALPGGPEVRSRVGLLSHASLLYAPLTARENVLFSARLHGLDDPEGATEAALARMRVLDRADAPVRLLSRGLQQRVSIARATVHEPRLLLLDEPYTGLDELGAGALTALLERLMASGTTLVLVTHHLAEGLALATQAAIMRAGLFARHEPGHEIDRSAYGTLYREAIGA